MARLGVREIPDVQGKVLHTGRHLEDVNERGIVMMVTRHRDHNRSSRYFYPWGVVGWIRLAEDDERAEP